MRRSWEGPADNGLDEPVTLTARQLRSLKWGARAGQFAMVLALAAAAFVGWSSFRAEKQGSTPNATVASIAGEARPAENVSADAATPAGGPSNNAAPAAALNNPAPASVPTSTSATRASTSKRAVARTPRHTAETAGLSKPVTEQLDAPGVPAVNPTPSAAPVTSEPAKAATQDSSAAHR
jgi:hypothetical protein